MREEQFEEIPRLPSSLDRNLNEPDLGADKLARMGDDRIFGDLETGEDLIVILRRTCR